MSRWIIQGITWLVALMLATGCATHANTTEQVGPKWQPAPPNLRQEARLHLPAEPLTIDSARAADTAAFDLLGNLMEGLVRPGESGTVAPGVAERWETADGRHFTFFLRKDARWSDGSLVTAHDFAYAWMRALDPQHGSDYAFLLYDIAGAEAWNTLGPEDPQFARRTGELMRQVQIAAPDPTILQVTLRVANPYWVNYIAHPVFYPQRASVVARESRQYGQAGAEFISNGPFVLERWTPGQQIVLRKNLAYWNAPSVRLERVHFRIERDGQRALRLFDIGELDQVVLPGELAVAEPMVQRMVQPSTMGLVFNLTRPRLADLQLRRAIHLAIDRVRLVDAVARFHAVPSAGLIPPDLAGGWQPDPGVRIPPHGNQEQARQLWELARRELEGQTLTIGLLHTPETEPIARTVKSLLEETLTGLAVELESVPFDQRLARARLGQFDLVLLGWAADHNDPLTLLELFVTDGPGNDARWMNREYDQRIVGARLGEMERQPALVEAERMLLEQLPLLPLYHPVWHWLMKGRLKGVKVVPLGARLDLTGAFIEQ